MTELLDRDAEYVLRDRKAFLGLLAFRHLTQAELARELGLSKQHINYVVNGERRASADTATRVASYLGVHPDELFHTDKTALSHT